MKQIRLGRLTITWTFVSRTWWEFHVLPFLDISDSRIFFGWLFVAFDIDTLPNQGGLE